jgi:hypothetical protein
LNLLLLFLGRSLFSVSCLLLFGGLFFLGLLLSLYGAIVIGLGNGCWSRLLVLALLVFILWSDLFCSVINNWFDLFLFLLWGLLNDNLFFLQFFLCMIWLFSFLLRSWSCGLFLASGVLEDGVITIAGVVR